MNFQALIFRQVTIENNFFQFFWYEHKILAYGLKKIRRRHDPYKHEKIKIA